MEQVEEAQPPGQIGAALSMAAAELAQVHVTADAGALPAACPSRWNPQVQAEPPEDARRDGELMIRCEPFCGHVRVLDADGAGVEGASVPGLRLARDELRGLHPVLADDKVSRRLRRWVAEPRH